MIVMMTQPVVHKQVRCTLKKATPAGLPFPYLIPLISNMYLKPHFIFYVVLIYADRGH